MLWIYASEESGRGKKLLNAIIGWRDSATDNSRESNPFAQFLFNKISPIALKWKIPSKIIIFPTKKRVKSIFSITNSISCRKSVATEEISPWHSKESTFTHQQVDRN